MHKKIIYRAKNGLMFEFGDSEPYYLEKIDATSVAGVFSSDTLMGTVGQITTNKTFGGRTVTCELAVVFFTEEMRLFQKDTLAHLVECFNPMVGGTLTIITDTGDYEIECYPSEVPRFQNDKIPSVYRFSVDFICDYPYFRQQGIINKHIVSGVNIINSSSVLDTPVKLYICDCSKGAIIQFQNKLGNNTLKLLAVDGAVTVDTKTFIATDENGEDVTNQIDLSSKIENCMLTYGKNKVILNIPESVISYYNLTLGVI